MSKELESTILQTMKWLDTLGIAVTKEKLRHCLFSMEHYVAPSHIDEKLKNMIESGAIVEEDFQLMLPYRKKRFAKDSVEGRERSYLMIKQAKPWLTLLSSHPGVEGIFICNGLSWLQSSENSDIDLYIIVKPGWIWQVRFVFATILAIFNKRPTEKTHANKICLSFFQTSDDLDLSKVALKDDIYLSWWIKCLLPVFDPKKHFDKILEKNESLVKNLGKPYWKQEKPVLSISPSSPSFLLSRLVMAQTSYLPKTFEKWAEKWQRSHFPAEIHNKMNKSTSVVVNNKMLKFHTGDRREEFRDVFRK